MTDPKDDETRADPTPPDGASGGDRGAGEELREGLQHLFSAARKVIKSAEPAVSKSLDDAERVFGKIGRGGEVVAQEATKEVAKLFSGLADKLRAVANRADDDEQRRDEASTRTPSDSDEKR